MAATPRLPGRARDPSPRCVCVIVTRDRPALLGQCLHAVRGQHGAPDAIIVVDNASGPATQTLLAANPDLHVLRLSENRGGAGGFHAGIECALQHGAEWVWLMDDDGRPATPDCLGRLHRTAATTGADLVGPLVIDPARTGYLSFPIRLRHRTRFTLAEIDPRRPIPGFAHLFNGALIRAGLFRRIGLPEPRFVIRGDEVEFLLRARHGGAAIMLDTGAHFLHPGSHAEIHPIFGGLFYAVVPTDPAKQYYHFRNRGFIFLQHRMWGWLAADIVRYAAHYLLTRHPDPAGFAHWLAATRDGWSGRFMHGCGNDAAPAASLSSPRAFGTGIA